MKGSLYLRPETLSLKSYGLNSAIMSSLSVVHYYIVLYCIILYCTALYCIVRCIVLYCIVLNKRDCLHSMYEIANVNRLAIAIYK